MIKISIDEASGFDILSIYDVKINKSENEEKVKKNRELFSLLYQELSAYIPRIADIIESEEYKNLYIANSETFDMVALAKEDKVLASDVDRSNHKRYIAKMKLQQKHFSDTPLQETKTGYEKYGHNKTI